MEGGSIPLVRTSLLSTPTAGAQTPHPQRPACPAHPPQNAYQDCHNFIFVTLVAKMLAKYARF